MKRIICLITALCLVLGSFSFCFAAVSDSQAASIVSDLSNIKTTISNIYTKVNGIYNALFDDNHSVAYWASAIASWMQPIYQALTTNLVANLNLEPIIAGLNSIHIENGVTTYTPHLVDSSGRSIGDTASLLYGLLNRISGTIYKNGNYITASYNSYGLATGSNNTATNNIFDAINNNLIALNNSSIQDHNDLFNYTKGYPFSIVNVNTAENETFTPYSFGNALVRYLQKIQYPVARLGFILASDERIAAQEAAAANEEAVVDNFIDSTGDGSASPSDIGSISDLSSGYKSNFGSDASVSGIFNIFNSNNMGWFSQETANQLDTTTRSRRGSSFNTPLLDRQIEDIYDQIGVNND